MNFKTAYLIPGLLALAGLAAAQEPPAAAPADPLQEALGQMDDQDAMVRRQGIEKLRRLRDPKAAPALLKALGDANAFVRSAAVDALGQMRNPEAAPEIIRLLREDKDAPVRQQAAIVLSYFGDRAAIPNLVAALDDSERAVRFAAARTLGNMKAAEAEERLAALVADPDEGMRQVAAGALGRLGSAKAAGALAGALKDPSAPVRREAVKALGIIGTDAAQLKPLLEDADPMVRLYAAAGLAKLGDGSGEGAAIALLAHEDASVRAMAANHLGDFGTKTRGLPGLTQAAAKEQTPAVAQALQFALARLKARLGIVDEPEQKPEPEKKEKPAPKKPAPKKTPAKDGKK